MNPIKPLKLGSLTLPSNIIYSPLAGCSDYPFRQMVKLYHPGLVYCEMVKMDALVRHEPNTFHLLDYDPSMHPIGAQICGSKLEYAAESAKIIEDLGFDVVDLNCGCPVDKVTKDGSGSGMLKTPDLIGEILRKMVDAVSIPVTVKIRAGWDEGMINAPQITKIAEDAGAVAIAIHGRTRVQKYRGDANWDYIRDCVEASKTIKVLGNGDVFDGQAGLSLFEHTGCDGILVSRGSMGKPWIAEDIERFARGEEERIATPTMIRSALLKHMKFIQAYQVEKRAVIDMRRVGCWYLRSQKGTKKLREGINRAQSMSEVDALIRNFDWEEQPALCHS